MFAHEMVPWDRLNHSDARGEWGNICIFHHRRVSDLWKQNTGTDADHSTGLYKFMAHLGTQKKIKDVMKIKTL